LSLSSPFSLTLFKRSFFVQAEPGGDIGLEAMLGGGSLLPHSHLLLIVLWQLSRKLAELILWLPKMSIGIQLFIMIN
jgi:hypothetical protein